MADKVSVYKKWLDKGYILEKFNGHSGNGYYIITVQDYEMGYRDWKYVSSSQKGALESLKTGLY